MNQARCCQGYREIDGQCRPVCGSGCLNGGSCVAPNTCSCTTGWTGSNCQQDICECCNSNVCGSIQYSKCINTPGSYRCDCLFGATTSRPCTVPPNPSPPKNVSVSEVATKSANITWQAPSTQLNNELSGYMIVLRELNFHLLNLTFNVSANTLMYTFIELEEYSRYVFEIRSISIHSFVSTFETVSFTTMQAAPSSPPEAVSGSSLGPYAISLAWSPPPPIDVNGNISHYVINITEVETDRNFQETSVTTATTIESLHPFYTYNFVVAAVTNDIGVFTDSFIMRTNESNPSGPPLDVMAVVLSSNEVLLSWSPPETDKQNGIIVEYTIVIIDVYFNVSSRTITIDAVSEYTLTGLEEFALYTYYISAATGVGNGPPSIAQNFTTFEAGPSSPPQSVEGDFHSSRAITFSWLPPPPVDINGVIKYYVARVSERFTGRSWTFFAVDLEVHVGSLHPYFLYDCSVAAHTIETGPFSEAISVRTDEEAPIAPPINLYAETTARSLFISWEPPAIEFTNGLIRHYSVRLYEAQTGIGYLHESNDTEITIPNLHPYYTYECSVAAYTVAIGPYSNSITEMLEEAEPEGPPLNISGLANVESIELIWSPPAEELRNGIIRSYIILVTEIETGRSQNHTSHHQNFTLLSLHPYYQYTVQISAVTISAGPFSSPVIIRTKEAAPTSTVQNVSAVALSFDSIALSWSSPSEEERNGRIRGYTVILKTENRTQKVNTTSNYLVIDGLKAFTAYDVSIGSYTSAGFGPYSVNIRVTTDQTAPSAPPGNVTATAVLAESLTLSWLPPPADRHNGIITHYVVNITDLYSGQVESLQSETTLISISYLHPYLSYKLTVVAVTVSEGPISSPLTVQTMEALPSGYPMDLNVSSVQSRSVTISWEPPAFLERNGEIIGYDVTSTTTNDELVSQQRVSNLSTQFSDLKPFSTYLVTVSASTVVGAGPQTPAMSFTTLQDAPESAPQDLATEIIDSRTIRLSWSPPEESSRNGIISGYRIELLEIQTDAVLEYLSTLTSIVIGSLHPYHTYQWSVAASTVSRGPFSRNISVTTPQDVPTGSPTNIVVNAVNTSSLSLSWDLPLDQKRNGIITVYEIIVYELESEVNSTPRSYITALLRIAILDLEPHTVYRIFIAASTVVGFGPLSPALTIRTLEDAPDSHPVNLTGYAINSTHVHLNWEPPSEEDLNGILRLFKVNITEDITGIKTQYITGPESTEIEIGPLHPDYNYHCTVVAFTVAEGPHTNILVLRTAEDAPSSGPINVSIEALTTSTALISWAAPLLEDQNGLIRVYELHLSSDIENRTFVMSSNVTTVNITSLRPYTNYSCSIYAVTITSGPPTRTIFTTFEDAPITTPVNLIVESFSPTELLLQWNEPVGHANGIIRLYNVRVVENETGLVEQFSTREQSIIVDSRHPFYHYHCAVSAETVAPGPWTLPVSILMPETSPSQPPTQVVAESVTPTSIEFNWLDPPEASLNGRLRGYYLLLTEKLTDKAIEAKSVLSNKIFESLHPFYNYTLSVAAYTVGIGPLSEPTEVRTPPDSPSAPPRNVRASIVSPRKIKLSWKPPQYSHRNGLITGYSVTITSQHSARQLETPITSIVISDLRPFSQYRFSVLAINEAGNGPSSKTAIISTPEDAPEAAPTLFQALSIWPDSIQLSWEPPAPANLTNGVITHYVLNVVVLNTEEKYSIKVLSHTSHTIGDLHPFYSYMISVLAVTVSRGPESSPLTVTTLQDVPSGYPQNISLSIVNPSSISLSWEPVSTEESNGKIKYYVVKILNVNNGNQFTMKTRGSMTELLIDLHPSFIYHITVAAATVIGVGPMSEQYKIKMPEDVPSGVPLNFTAEESSSRSVYLTWDLPHYNSRNGLITSYTVIANKVNEDENILTLEVIGRMNILINFLHPFHSYEFRIAANTSLGQGPFSFPVIARTLEEAPSSPPHDVELIRKLSRSLVVAWKVPPSDELNGIVRSFIVKVASWEGLTTSNTLANATTIELMDLHPYQPYNITVAAVTISEGPFSLPLTAITSQDAPSASPQKVMVESLSSMSIFMSWEPPSPFEQNGVIIRYEIVVQGLIDSKHSTSKETVEAPVLTYVKEGLSPFTEYTVRIAALTFAGEGPFSEQVIIRTMESLPGPPSSVYIKTYNTTIIKLDWNEPLQPNGIILGYQVIFKGFLIQPSKEDENLNEAILLDGPKVLNYGPTKHVTVVDHLTAGLTYNFTVRAQNSAGFGANQTISTTLNNDEVETEKILPTENPIFPFVIIVIVLIIVVILLVTFIVWRKIRKLIKNRQTVTDPDEGTGSRRYAHLHESESENQTGPDSTSAQSDRPPADDALAANATGEYKEDRV